VLNSETGRQKGSESEGGVLSALSAVNRAEGEVFIKRGRLALGIYECPRQQFCIIPAYILMKIVSRLSSPNMHTSWTFILSTLTLLSGGYCSLIYFIFGFHLPV